MEGELSKRESDVNWAFMGMRKGVWKLVEQEGKKNRNRG